MTDALFVATRKGLFRLERAAEGWRIAQSDFLGDHVNLVLSDRRSDAVYAAFTLGHFGAKLRRSDDGGKSWAEVTTPALPSKPEPKPDSDPDSPEPVDSATWNVSALWALAAGGSDQPGRVWCGTIPGALFKSDDRGDSWQLVTSLWNEPGRLRWFGGGSDEPALHSICVDPRNSHRLIVGISCGGVWVSENDGDSWAVQTTGMFAEYMPPERREDPLIQDPHCLAQCPADPNVIWAQHHNGVFVSRDRSESWTHLDGARPSGFGFAVAVHPRDPNTAWFVPADYDDRRVPVSGKVVVSRTRDGGENFEVLSRGLPQEHAYDITFRHALDVNRTGQCLAFGTTTGSLFISEDEGDSWQHITAHLPPIYAVRFR